MTNRDTFSGYHPLVNFAHFTAVIAFAMVFIHPVCLILSFGCAFSYAVYLKGQKALRAALIYALPMTLVAALINPAFNHEGATILAYLPSGNPLTLESIVYGVVAALLLITVVIWFVCFSIIITSDKFVYLFGRIIPMLSLVLSMSLRFVPRFIEQGKIVSNAQKCVGQDVSNGNILQRVRRRIKILSIIVTWALENAIETADSMKSRGYGLPGRTAFSIYRFDRRDACALAFIALCVMLTIAGSVTGELYFRYFPTIKGVDTAVLPLSVGYSAAYFALGAMPLILNLTEDYHWRHMALKT